MDVRACLASSVRVSTLPEAYLLFLTPGAFRYFNTEVYGKHTIEVRFELGYPILKEKVPFQNILKENILV